MIATEAVSLTNAALASLSTEQSALPETKKLYDETILKIREAALKGLNETTLSYTLAWAGIATTVINRLRQDGFIIKTELTACERGIFQLPITWRG